MQLANMNNMSHSLRDQFSRFQQRQSESAPCRAVLISCATILAVCACVLVTWSYTSLELATRAELHHPVGEIDRANAASVLVLISLDGFRADFLERFRAPNLARLARRGVRVRAMRPVFPSKTFPNHWSIVTGLYPESHGIVANSFLARDFRDANDTVFTLKKSATDARFWGGVPLWSVAEQNNVRTGTVFWPGSEVALPGLPRPTIVTAPYNASMPNRERAAIAARMVREGLRFVTLYMETVDSAGHKLGVDGTAAEAGIQLAIDDVDAAIGLLMASLDRADIVADFIVVADHGMATVSLTERTIDLDTLLGPLAGIMPYRLLDFNAPGDSAPLLGIYLDEQNVTLARSVAAQLRDPNATFYAREDIPEAYHYRNNIRIPDVLGVADVGYLFKKPGMSQWTYSGTHGYNNSAPEMQAICITSGPSFRIGATVDSLANLDLINVMATILGVSPPPNNGTLAGIDSLLRKSLFAPVPTSTLTKTTMKSDTTI